jgi:hypothetical protein
LKRESKVLEIVKKETIKFSEINCNMLTSDKKLVSFRCSFQSLSIIWG